MQPALATKDDEAGRRKPDPKAEFRYARRAEAEYVRRLNSVAATVASIVRGIIDPDRPSMDDVVRLQEAMRRYSELLKPWAWSVTQRMHAEVNARDLTTWKTVAAKMVRPLMREIETAPTGAIMQKTLAEQVDLITSLPIELGQRVHEMTVEALATSARFPEREAEIREMLAETHPTATGLWLRNRAKLIARTETARVSSVLTQARAQHVGSDGYIWRSARDRRVRITHKRLEGTFHRWSEPPVSEETGERSHPGQIWNCRCWPEPVLPDYER